MMANADTKERGLGDERRKDPTAGNTQEHRGADVAPEERGRTTVADPVVAKIAGMAAREVPGVHKLGGGVTRTLGAMRERVPGGRSASSVTQGVKVEVGERQAAVDLVLVVEYGVAIG